MTIQEIIKAMVLAESQDERMELAEKLTDAIGEGNPSNDEMEKLNAEIERLNGEVKTHKQKYIDRFFGGNPEGETKPAKEDTKTEEEKKAETISTQDIVKEMGK